MKRPPSLPMRFLHDRRATTSVEFALVCIPLFTAIFGFVIFGYVLHGKSELQASVDAGTRLAYIHGDGDLAAIEAAVVRRFGSKAGEFSVEATSSTEDDGRQVVTVEADWVMSFGVPALGVPTDFSLSHSATAEVRP